MKWPALHSGWLSKTGFVLSLLTAACGPEDDNDDSVGSGAAGSGGAPAGAAGSTAAGTAGATGGAAGAGGVGGSAEAGTGGGTAGGAGAASDVPFVSFDEFSYRLVLTCGNFICHLPNYYPPDFSNKYGDLHSILTTWTVPNCGNAPIVVPGDPDASAMIKLVKRQCGDLYMPSTCPEGTELCIYPDELETFVNWIKGGALAE